MSNVAIDLFRLPPVEFEGEKFDTLIECVLRHSRCGRTNIVNWFDGIQSCQTNAANQWYLFGIPPVFTSDLGSHFVSSWWQTLCASNGVRLTHGQGYHHQSNGSAERAGLQIIDRLIKWKVQRVEHVRDVDNPLESASRHSRLVMGLTLHNSVWTPPTHGKPSLPSSQGMRRRPKFCTTAITHRQGSFGSIECQTPNGSGTNQCTSQRKPCFPSRR